MKLEYGALGCSTGEEPYTIAMVLKEYLPPDINIKILGTDVSPKVVAQAQIGKYSLGPEDLINAYFLSKYFTQRDRIYSVVPIIKSYVTFRVFNLMNDFPFQVYLT
ncbi:MAG: hypothetical protein MZU91_06050 [Desulfosudis oleivorans]|nr:hypothetical protein [Desulfosudis oleivorans]